MRAAQEQSGAAPARAARGDAHARRPAAGRGALGRFRRWQRRGARCMLCHACRMRCSPYACGGFPARCRTRTGRHVRRADQRERRPDSAHGPANGAAARRRARAHALPARALAQHLLQPRAAAPAGARRRRLAGARAAAVRGGCARRAAAPAQQPGCAQPPRRCHGRTALPPFHAARAAPGRSALRAGGESPGREPMAGATGLCICEWGEPPLGCQFGKRMVAAEGGAEGVVEVHTRLLSETRGRSGWLQDLGTAWRAVRARPPRRRGAATLRGGASAVPAAARWAARALGLGRRGQFAGAAALRAGRAAGPGAQPQPQWWRRVAQQPAGGCSRRARSLAVVSTAPSARPAAWAPWRAAPAAGLSGGRHAGF